MDNFIQLYIYFPSSLFECIREKPILIENECELKYCQKEDFSSGICTINNNIIKTQWLNDIVVFNSDKLRYGSFAINSKGDLIYECSVEEKKGIRIFYWLKKSGHFYFKNENGEYISTKKIIVKNGNDYPIRYESKK